MSEQSKSLMEDFSAMRGDNETPIEVESWSGLFDEGYEAIVCNINDRQAHPLFKKKCEMVNASLHWVKDGSTNHWPCISLQSPAVENFQPQWGGPGYGAIRYCRMCKHIDCLHVWTKSVKYAVRCSPFSAHVRVVSTCKWCERKIVTNGYTSYLPAPGFDKFMQDGHVLMNRVLIECGKPPLVIDYYGSWWFCERAENIAMMLSTRRGQEAEQLIKQWAAKVSGPSCAPIIFTANP